MKSVASLTPTMKFFIYSLHLLFFHQISAASDIAALYNSEKWIPVHTKEDSVHLPPKPTNTWIDDDVEIFVSIAEYRDDRCPQTIKNLFSKAKNPKRVYIGMQFNIYFCRFLLSSFFETLSKQFLWKLTILPYYLNRYSSFITFYMIITIIRHLSLIVHHCLSCFSCEV